MKVCGKCKLEQDISMFGKNKHRKDGFQDRCKGCRRGNYNENKEVVLAKNKVYRDNHPEEFKMYKKKWEEIIGKDEIKRRKAIYYQNNSHLWVNRQTENEDDLRIKRKIRTSTREHKDKKNIYLKEKRQSDPLFKFKTTITNRVRGAFKAKSWRKNSSNKEMIGVDYDIAKEHIERQFTKGMTWENHGEWHIDHIIPLASAKTEEEMIALCHYTNLQPLWKMDNQKKHCKIPKVQTKLPL